MLANLIKYNSLPLERPLLDSTVVLPGDENTLFPTKDSLHAQKQLGDSFSFPGMTSITSEYRPWN